MSNIGVSVQFVYQMNRAGVDEVENAKKNARQSADLHGMISYG